MHTGSYVIRPCRGEGMHAHRVIRVVLVVGRYGKCTKFAQHSCTQLPNVEPEGLRPISANFLMVLSVRSQGDSYATAGSTDFVFPLGESIPIGYQSDDVETMYMLARRHILQQVPDQPQVQLVQSA